MSSPAVDIAGLLEAQGLGTAGTTLFVGRDPGGTTLTISVYDTGGLPPNPKYSRDEPSVQIAVWGAANDYSGGYTKALAIKDYLLGLTSQTIGTKTYFAFNMRTDITFVGYDQNQRPQFTLNFRLIVDDGDVGNRTSL